MSASQPSSQSAEERQSAEATLWGQIDRLAPGQRPLVDSTRQWLTERLPGAHEVVYAYRDCVVISYSPNGHGYEGVLAIRASADGVKLYLNQGKGLPDPAKRLRGSGAQARWLHLEDPGTLAVPEGVALVDEAILRAKIPFDPAVRGPIVMRSDSSKTRP